MTPRSRCSPSVGPPFRTSCSDAYRASAADFRLARIPSLPADTARTPRADRLRCFIQSDFAARLVIGSPLIHEYATRFTTTIIRWAAPDAHWHRDCLVLDSEITSGVTLWICRQVRRDRASGSCTQHATALSFLATLRIRIHCDRSDGRVVCPTQCPVLDGGWPPIL